MCLFINDPCTHHMVALKHIIRYGKGTLLYGLHLSSTSTHTLLSYTDANWGSCQIFDFSLPVIAFILAIISFLGPLKNNLLYSTLVLKLSIVVLLILSLNLAGFTIFFWNFTVLSRTLLLFIVATLVLNIFLIIQFTINAASTLKWTFTLFMKVVRGQVRVFHVPSYFQIADIFIKGLPMQLFSNF